MKFYEVKTDAVSETIQAINRDEAASKFAQDEGFSSRNESDLRDEIEAIDGWMHIIEIEMITELKIYWDEQDPQDTGWAYRETYADGRQESGAYEPQTHRASLRQMIRDLMDQNGLDHSEYTITEHDADGGYVVATRI